jgi:integrase
MPDRKLRLTTEVIKKALPAPPGEKTGYILWDTEVPGLGCRVSPRGKKTFILYYRNADGTRRKPRVGEFGKLTIYQARDIARTWLAEVALGSDPSQVRQETRKAPTVAEVCDRYLEEYARPLKKPSSVATDELYITLHLKPQLGSRKVASITFKDVEALHRRLKDTPIQANRVLALVSKILNLCERWGLRPSHSNPCGQIERFKERQVHRPLTELELARLAKVMREAESGADPSVAEDSRAIAAIRLILFTGARRSEVLNLRWDEIDFDLGALRLHDSKTGPKVVWLNSAAREVLTAQEPMVGNPYVFPSPRKPGRPLYDCKGVWRRIRKRAGLEDVRLHDLRHGFAATAAAGGLSLHQIGQLLGHKRAQTTQRYSDMLADPKRQAAEIVGQALTRAMGGKGE